MAIVDDRIYETGSASGTTVALGGRKSSGFRTFSQSNVGNGNQCRVVIDYKDPRTGLPVDEWAVVVATYNSSPNTLTINTWLKSSNGGSAVTWVSGRTYDVYIDVDSTWILNPSYPAWIQLNDANALYGDSTLGVLIQQQNASTGITWRNSAGDSYGSLSSAGIWTFKNATASTGATTVRVDAGQGQSTTNLHEWRNNSGTNLATVSSTGAITSTAAVTGTAMTISGGSGASSWTTISGSYVGIKFGGGAPAFADAALFGNGTDVFVNRPTGGVLYFRLNNSTQMSLSATSLDFIDAVNISFGTSTGTKIGTATSQKLSFWNATPIVQPTTGVAAATFVANTSLIANDTATFDGYTIGQVVKALRNSGILA